MSLPLVHVWGHEEWLTTHVAEQIAARWPGDPGRVRRSSVFSVAPGALSLEELDQLGARLRDGLTEAHTIGSLQRPAWCRSTLLIAPHRGTTDDRARMAERVAEHLLGRAPQLRTAVVYQLEHRYEPTALRELGSALFGNPLAEQVLVLEHDDDLVAWLHEPPPAHRPIEVRPVVIPTTDPDRARWSKERELGLSVAELHAIVTHFDEPGRSQRRADRGLPPGPTDAELELLAQTWSEHCKHKEFAALVRITDARDGSSRILDSLFQSTIVAATEDVRTQLASEGADWLLSVFSDNAGVVAFDDETSFVLKVETHNSPSALDPYGGAMTGILGNNRDPLGTGRGGASLLFNTNVLCFGPLDYAEPLLPGQLHPRVIYDGVLAGVQAGGNQSGVPTVNGAVLFDRRFAGKPLVYCGTGALLPRRDVAGAALHEKNLAVGDRVVMIGGRVGRDGIHGATFSSRTMDANAPRSVVQIGSPFTQKKLADFLADVGPRGLVSAITDNGAGGLASSVGELARLTGGAHLDLAAVPLKAPGLQPWEILVSESQERMTLGVRPEHLPELVRAAATHDVELTVLGTFDDLGSFRVSYGELAVCDLDLEFLHDGYPRVQLQATIVPPSRTPWVTPPAHEHEPPSHTLLALLRAPNVSSRERVVRRYDHEVQARTVVKPYMERAPQDAAVLRVGLRADDARGLAVASGICPQYGDLDAYQAAACAFDEAVRALVAVGVRLPFGEHAADFVCACDNFCMPNVRFDATSNPDGPEKLGKLVRMAEATFDVATAYRVPLVSGKDSMKNDFVSGGKTISVPPTVLFTAVGKVRDTRTTVTAEVKAVGDRVYLLEASPPRDDDRALGGAGLGASELARLWGVPGGAVPRLDIEAARALYIDMGRAHDVALFVSCHDLSDGGLAVALAEACLGGGLGACIEPPVRDALAFWFGESPSRFLVTVRPARAAELESRFGLRAIRLGQVERGALRLGAESVSLAALREAYEGSGLP